MDGLIKTFLDLAEIDEVFPNENRVLKYVKKRLKAANTPFKQDAFGNIIATIKGQSPESLAICGHVDIAAPLKDRKILIKDDVIKTDGAGLLGGDDKTAVAAMLELADYLHKQKTKPTRTIELLFTLGEEAGLKGAIALDYSLVTAKQVLVFDWLGGVNHIIAQSPVYYRFDITYIGKDAHPAQWRQGKNAGFALMDVASQLQQGEHVPGVIFNIGHVQIGNARNKVPGLAELKAEARSFDTEKAATVAKSIEMAFRKGIKEHGIKGDVVVHSENAAYTLNKKSDLLAKVTETLNTLNLKPVYETTYGCFDGNIFAKHGLDVVIMGAAYYNPHSPEEYVKISELKQLVMFLQQIAKME